MDGVVGLDLSLRNTGMCFIPPRWNGRKDSLVITSFPTVKTSPTYGSAAAKAYEDIRRCLEIANKIVGFIKYNDARHASIEGYAYSFAGGKNREGASASVTKLAELGGVVKSQVVLSCKMAPIVIQPNSARKTAVGSLKRGKQKDQVKQILNTFGFSFSNMDEMDAFVVGYALYCQVNEIRSVFVEG
jgi:hypothetical protein